MDSGRTAAYATVEWSRIVLPADRLPIEVLLGEVPEVPWNNLMSSGIQVPSGARERILELWNDQVEAIHFRAPDEVIDAAGIHRGRGLGGDCGVGGDGRLGPHGARLAGPRLVVTLACVRCCRCVDCIGCVGCVGCVGLRSSVGRRGVTA